MRHASVKDYEKALAGGEPTWKNGEASLTRALNWYNYHSDTKESKKFALSYLKEIQAPKKDIEILEKVSDAEFQNLGFVCRIKLRGGPISDDSEQWIDSFFKRLKLKVQPIVEAKVVETKTVSIQERVVDKSREHIGELEGQIDECVNSRKFNTFNPYQWMQSSGVKGAHTKVIIQHYTKTLGELEEALLGKDKDLVEGYSYLTKPQLKAFITLIKSVISDAEKVAHNGKALRAPRKKKAQPVSKVISKLLFKKEDNEYKIASINPIDIVGCMQLWTFNTKTRKLGCYLANDADGLTVKGTTLLNFNETSSIQKTVRKPEIVLPLVTKSGKVALKKVLSDINATAQPLTGRINSDTILCRVIK
jgi:hypothetical protein